MDSLDPIRRSQNMSRIRHKDTKPEQVVRKLVSALGYRYRLHVRYLPGKPDLSIRRLKRAIFVHGCFWHQHKKCREGRLPGSRIEYWKPKLERNVERDRLHLKALRKDGWEVLIVWECETTDPSLVSRLNAFLKS